LSIWNVKTHRFEGYWISDGVYESIAIQKQLGTKQDWLQLDSQVFCVKLHTFDRYWISNNLAWIQSRSNSEQNRSDCNQILMYCVCEITRYQASDALHGNIAIQEQLRKHCTTGLLSIEYVKSAHKLCKERTHLLWASLQ
jgi:hypothetical protein